MSIHGITVALRERISSGADPLGDPVVSYGSPVAVMNVLVAPATGEELTDTFTLTGRRAVYTLGIPKGDTHNWEGGKVSFFGHDFNVIGPETQGIDAMVPGQWNKKVQVELIES